jgi:hypothetical protein
MPVSMSGKLSRKSDFWKASEQLRLCPIALLMPASADDVVHSVLMHEVPQRLSPCRLAVAAMGGRSMLPAVVSQPHLNQDPPQAPFPRVFALIALLSMLSLPDVETEAELTQQPSQQFFSGWLALPVSLLCSILVEWGAHPRLESKPLVL